MSVVMPVHNAAETVGAAIGSILGQTMRALELIVVDDGSTDGSAEVVEAISDPRLRHVTLEERRGQANAANVGIDQARAPLLARLDADDLALPGRLERQLKELSRSRRPAVLGSAALELSAAGSVGRVLAPLRSPAGVRWTALFTAPFLNSTSVFDRRRFEAFGLRFDQSVGESEDYDLWARALEHGNGSNLADPLVLYRVHPAQASQARRELQEQVQRHVSLRTVRAWLPRLVVTEEEWEPVWRLGAEKGCGDSGLDEDALLGLLDVARLFLEGNVVDGEREVRGAVTRLVFRNLRSVTSSRSRSALTRRTLSLDRVALGGAPEGVLRRVRARASRRRAREWLDTTR